MSSILCVARANLPRAIGFSRLLVRRSYLSNMFSSPSFLRNLVVATVDTSCHWQGTKYCKRRARKKACAPRAGVTQADSSINKPTSATSGRPSGRAARSSNGVQANLKSNRWDFMNLTHSSCVDFFVCSGRVGLVCGCQHVYGA